MRLLKQMLHCNTVQTPMSTFARAAAVLRLCATDQLAPWGDSKADCVVLLSMYVYVVSFE